MPRADARLCVQVVDLALRRRSLLYNTTNVAQLGDMFTLGLMNTWCLKMQPLIDKKSKRTPSWKEQYRLKCSCFQISHYMYTIVLENSVLMHKLK